MSTSDFVQKDCNLNDGGCNDNKNGNSNYQEHSSLESVSILDDPNFDYDCTWLIRIRGLPWSATKKEIVQFFDGVNILNGENGVHLITLSGNKSRPLGEAYIQLASEEDFNKAQNFHRQNMGQRYIEIFTAKFEDFKTILSKQLNLRHESVLRLRGLPWNATEKDIAEFFKGLQIYEDRGIHIHFDRTGRASGEAFVRFKTAGDCDQALKRNMAELGNRYIEIFRSTEAQLMRSIELTNDNRERKNGGSNWIGSNRSTRSHPYALDKTPHKNYREIYQGLSGNGGGNDNNSGSSRSMRGSGSSRNMRGSGGNYNNNGNNFGGGGFGNNNSGPFNNSGSSFGNNNSGPFNNSGGSFGNNNGGGCGSGFFSNGNGNGGGFGNNNSGPFNNSGGNFGNNNSGPFNNSNGSFGNNNGGNCGGSFFANGNGSGGGFGNNSGSRGTDEHLVYLRGMPYYCDEMDIYKFFAPLKPMRCKIIINDNGMPSGQAVASFETHEEATVALRKDKEKMGSRYIELFYDGRSGQSRRRF